MKRMSGKIGFADTVVIYYSREDRCWVAHSLRTDQIGTGNRIVDALADVMRAVDQVCALAASDSSIAYLREAPAEIRKLARRAKKLPGEIHEIAHRMARGSWPRDIRVDVTPTRQSESFTTRLGEVNSK